MNCKRIGTSFRTITLAGIVAAAIAPGWSHASALTASALLHRGGQAAPAPAGGNAYSVVVARGVPPQTADSLRNDLISDGYTTAQTRDDGNGAAVVVLSNLPTREVADKLLADLKKAGYTPEGVEQGSGSGASASATAGSIESVYRVEVAEFGTEAEAESGRKTLADEGFVNVDVVPDSGKYLLLLGTFKRKEDAQGLLSDVNKAGFALAEVVSREKVNTGDSRESNSQAVSSLPENQQAETRDVLDMAQKVESGEATAAEIKELREKIQQLTDTQKRIVKQEESSRSTEREKLQKMFPLYRKFDHAMMAKNYDEAAEAIAEMKQIDPNDLFLPGREQQLAQAKSGGSAPAQSASSAGSQASSSATADPAEVQKKINEARSLESQGNNAGALSTYRAVLEMDPTNSEARQKVVALATAASDSTSAANEESAGLAGLLKNKNILYGAGALVALIIIAIVLKGRKSKTAPREARGEAGAFGASTGPDFIDPLADGGGYSGMSADSMDIGNTGLNAAGAGLESSNIAGTTAPEFATFGTDDDEETQVAQAPLRPAPAPVETPPESDTVSLEGFGSSEAHPPAPELPAPAAPQPAAAAESDDIVSINFADEPAPTPAPASAAASSPAASAAPQSAATPTPPHGGSALDADLEALLKGTFPGAAAGAASESVLESATPGRGVEDMVSPGEPSQPAQRLVYEQSFENETEGAAPQGWRGDYDYASLQVVRLDEAGHTKCLRYDKPDGSGSATYHLSFPNATGLVTAEFDIRCDQKNKFLLGVYFEHNEDFKQSIHTVVHQLDPNAPAMLRIQGAATPYDMGTWRRVRYEIDLHSGTIDGYVDNEQVVTGAALANAPDSINTISIRDNLATTGTMFVDNIRISES